MMATQAIAAAARAGSLRFESVAVFPNLRALTWDGDVLFASCGYKLLAGNATNGFAWREVASYRPTWWRNLTSRSRLSSRLVRDGFHALAIAPGGNLIAAMPGAIATLHPGENEFCPTHLIQRGTRPLHITAVPDGRVFWGEYFDNANRDEVYIYASSDAGLSWNVAYTFEKHSIRHVHNVLYDSWEKCLWVFTGDYGRECRILRASLDFSQVDEVLCGNQQARAVAAVIVEDGLYFASDTPLEQNYVYFLHRHGRLHRLSPIPSSSIYSCKNATGMFFSTMVEPSQVNQTREVQMFGSADGGNWLRLASWQKDFWPSKFFQYGNAFLPDGENNTDMVAVTTVAVENADLHTQVFRSTLV